MNLVFFYLLFKSLFLELVLKECEKHFCIEAKFKKKSFSLRKQLFELFCPIQQKTAK